MALDAATIARWIEPLAREPGEMADVLVERRLETLLEWRDGEVVATRHVAIEALAARRQRGNAQILAAVSRADEAGLREALRQLQAALGRPSLPIRPGKARTEQAEPPEPIERWRKRLGALFSRSAPRHRLQWRLLEVARDVYPAHAAPSSHARALVSVTGRFVAASRRGDESRRFSFHGPESDALGDELRSALQRAAEPREAPVACLEGEIDAVLAGGCAAVLFHEILSHPLEAGAMSPLSGLAEARLAAAELEVRDDPTRLDLFGGYAYDDEGTRPRPVKLLDGGRLAGRLTTRSSAARMGTETSNGHARRAEATDAPLPRGANLVVSGGSVTREEMSRRLGQGLWIEEVDSGSVELASGAFQLRFPRARRVRRGQLADELGPGVLCGDILSSLKHVEPGLGREPHVYRALGWCARGGQVVPVQGAAPDVMIRGLSVRSQP